MAMTMRAQIKKRAQGYVNSKIRGYADMWQLCDEEIFVFNINPDEWPLMVATYDAYQAFLNIVGAEDVGFTTAAVEEERRRRPEFFDTIPMMSEQEFEVLAQEWSGLTAEQVGKVYGKMRYAALRER